MTIFCGVLISLLLGTERQCSAQAWAVKMFDTTSHDFGAVARGAKTEFAFEFTNIYEEDLHIAAVRSSCGCTSPTITKSNLKTWEKAAIVAQFNTRSFIGQKQAVITVTIDKPFYAEVQLSVKGLIRSDIVAEPGEIQFGDVDQGSAKEAKTRISYAGRSSWQIKDVLSTNDHVEVRLTKEKQVPGLVAYIMTVKLKESAPPGVLQDELVIVTDDAQFSKISLPVSATVRPPLSIAPSSIELGDIKMGGSKQQRLVVRGKEAFEITEILCEDERFEFKIPKGSKAVHMIPFEFKSAVAAAAVAEPTPSSDTTAKTTDTAEKKSEEKKEDATGRFVQKITVKTSLGDKIALECTVQGNLIR